MCCRTVSIHPILRYTSRKIPDSGGGVELIGVMAMPVCVITGQREACGLGKMFDASQPRNINIRQQVFRH